MPDDDAAAEPADLPRDMDALLEELRRRVERRREAGEIPAQLEYDLDAYLRGVSHAVVDDDSLHVRVDAVRHLASMPYQKAPAQSNLPGGQLLHETVARLVQRPVEAQLAEMRRFNGAVVRALDAVQATFAQFDGRLRGLESGVWRAEQILTPLPDDAGTEMLHEMAERLERLEQWHANEDFNPWYSNLDWESEFRGTGEQLLDRYRDLAGKLSGHSPALDIGCGRGEILELLTKEFDVQATGVEMDTRLAEECRSAGLDVIVGDGIRHLATLSDDSLGGLICIQVVEHLSSQQVLDLVHYAAEKVRPGGKAIVETLNPLSVYGMSRWFYLDPTHIRPLHPLYLQFLFESAGFTEAEIQYRSWLPVEIPLPLFGEDHALAADLNPILGRLNDLLYNPADFAIIATR